MQDRDDEPVLTNEQRGLLDDRMQAADEAAQKLVDEYADDPDLKFVATPSLIGNGIDVDNYPSSMPQTQLTPAQIKRIKRMMAGPMMRENQPCKKFITKEKRNKKLRLQKQARKTNR